MDERRKRLIDSYHQDIKGTMDGGPRKDIPESILGQHPDLYKRGWRGSDKNIALVMSRDKYLKNGHLDLGADLDTELHDDGEVVEKDPFDVIPDTTIQKGRSEKETIPVQGRSKKKRKKKKDDSRNINKDKRSPIGLCDMPYAQIPMSGEPVRRSGKREIDIDLVVKTLKEQHSFICIAGRKLYAFTGRYYEDITDKNNAAAVFKDFLSEETNRLIRDYTEIYNQLLSDKDIWYNSMEEIRRNRYVVVFWNGTYDIREQKFYEGMFWEEDHVFSILRFAYQERDMRGKGFIDDFIDTFCNGDPMRKRLFKEIVGFCISNFENKKACFYFLGVPNSGKSSVCRFLETAVGSDAYISVAVKQLNSRFVSGDLEGIKICADEDVAIRTPLRSEDVSLIKKITSSDKIRTDAKYQKPGQLHPECKLVWAGNGMMTFETSEDLQPLIDRMIIFPLDRVIPVEKRDPNIVDKLLMGRNYMISESLKELHNLVERGFQFTKVVPTEAYFNAQNFASGIEAFVETHCILDGDSRESTSVLYGTYIRFCKDHPEYKPKSINQFSSYIENKYGLKPYNDGNVRGKVGIQLCDYLRTDAVN